MKKGGKKILIAGGAGYIGSRLVPHLLKLGHNITVLDLLWFGNHLPSNVTIIKKDVFEVDKELLHGFEQVIFVAGLSNDPMAEYSPAANFIYNGAGPTYLAFVAKQAGIKRFIYASSCSVYGFTDNKELNEDDDVRSDYPYGISKLEGEMGILKMQNDSFSVICLRQGTVSGFSPRMRLDLFVNTMYMKAITEGIITVNNPIIWRPLLAIEDAILAYEKASSAPDRTNGVFNISSENRTVKSVADEIVKYFKDRKGLEIGLEVKNIPDYRNYKVSNQKAKNILGVKFTGSTKSILDELSNHIGENFDFKNDNYYNIKVFEKMNVNLFNRR